MIQLEGSVILRNIHGRSGVRGRAQGLGLIAQGAGGFPRQAGENVPAAEALAQEALADMASVRAVKRWGLGSHLRRSFRPKRGFRPTYLLKRPKTNYQIASPA